MSQQGLLQLKKAGQDGAATARAADKQRADDAPQSGPGESSQVSMPAFLLICHSIKVCVAGVTLGIWFVVGFVFWIPLLARATTSFTVSATHSNLVARGVHIPNAGLEHATLFYIDGFRSIIQSMFAPPPSEPTCAEFQVGRFMLEIGWAVVFWWVTLLAFSSIGVVLTPYSDTYLSLTWLWDQLGQFWTRRDVPSIQWTPGVGG